MNKLDKRIAKMMLNTRKDFPVAVSSSSLWIAIVDHLVMIFQDNDPLFDSFDFRKRCGAKVISLR